MLETFYFFIIIKYRYPNTKLFDPCQTDIRIQKIMTVCVFEKTIKCVHEW